MRALILSLLLLASPALAENLGLPAAARALRTACAIDLQRAVNRDMKRAFSAYPTLWGLTITDRNIGHRRVPNLQTLFTRIDAALPEGADFQPGDIVAWMLPGNPAHIGILSDQSAGSHPMALRNIGRGAQEKDILNRFPIIGHYRLTPEVVDRLRTLGAD